ncbi:hypothetical protein [Alkalicoccus daliensis]|uniref:Uncharacterized protein n=1 Tax=Alkalicoccus daliensis TaxID=745820 RepID=A0A1H0GZW1_9BACI|nr:hypothetical protein [Alkalicoccus daliensis]SDO12413.1 hypothetical protein SAMN04488053_107113 [Alkalicoccus daliensis]
MLLKMLLSMAALFMLIGGFVLFSLPEGSPGEFSLENSSQGAEDTELFSDESYLFFLEDEEIAEYIEKGTSALGGAEQYRLSEIESTLRSDDAAFVYAEPPSLTVTTQAREIFYHEGRIPDAEEMKKLLRDDRFIIQVRYLENRAYVYDVYIEQSGNEISPAEEKIMDEGSMMTLFFAVKDLKMNEEAVFIMEDPVNENSKAEYSLDFPGLSR